MESGFWTTLGAAIAGVGAGAYGMYRKVLADMRHDKVASLHDDAIDHLITNLREELHRLSVRLAAVEEQNRKCEERNDQLHQEILELKHKLHVT